MKTEKYLLRTLHGEMTEQVPFWFMRQAGRYLPEYRALRQEAGGFLDLVYDPEKASEVTLQPIRRFEMNGAILFSDILVIPQALGQGLRFETGEGPKLDAISSAKDLSHFNLEKIDQILEPIYETVSLTSSKLKSENFNQTTLIGFAGSPWTVACYMVEGGGSKTFEKTKKWAYSDPQTFAELIDLLSEATIHYLCRQIEAGAEAIQIFDSWSGILDEANFDHWVIKPSVKIVQRVKEKYPDIKIIGFPREAGVKTIDYVKKTEIDAVGMDFSMPIEWARDDLQSQTVVQGNLDPVCLLSGGDQLAHTATNILETFAEKPFIFNLGHGVIKETPVEHVEQLCKIIKDFKR